MGNKRWRGFCSQREWMVAASAVHCISSSDFGNTIRWSLTCRERLASSARQGGEAESVAAAGHNDPCPCANGSTFTRWSARDAEPRLALHWVNREMHQMISMMSEETAQTQAAPDMLWVPGGTF